MPAPKEVCSREQLCEFEKFTPRAFKGMFMSYMLEAEHGGWDGFERSDLTGIRRFVADLVLYAKHMDDPDEEIFTGSETFNKR